MKDNNIKKIMITVNGKPVGNGLFIDKITYAPVHPTPANVKDCVKSGI
ncbi:hypothetical protein ABDI30_18950 [Paenibacillus cisolokensis]